MLDVEISHAYCGSEENQRPLYFERKQNIAQYILACCSLLGPISVRVWAQTFNF